jgi:predicted  nucleic acid-binding Zn-ribbon protein
MGASRAAAGYCGGMSTEDELRQVEEDLTGLRTQVKDLREQIGDMGATDQVEISSMVNMADEMQEQIVELEQLRDDLRKKL